MIDEYIVHTDGSCRKDVGGWGFVIQSKDEILHGFGGAINCTNNHMEMMAAIQALRCFDGRNKIKIITDSQYLHHGMTIYLRQWIKNQYITSSGKRVKNRAFWQELRRLQNEHQPDWEWVRGHNGAKYNEMADSLALRGRQFAEDYIRGKREELSSIHNCERVDSRKSKFSMKDRLVHGRALLICGNGEMHGIH